MPSALFPHYDPTPASRHARRHRRFWTAIRYFAGFAAAAALVLSVQVVLIWNCGAQGGFVRWALDEMLVCCARAFPAELRFSGLYPPALQCNLERSRIVFLIAASAGTLLLVATAGLLLLFGVPPARGTRSNVGAVRNVVKSFRTTAILFVATFYALRSYIDQSLVADDRIYIWLEQRVTEDKWTALMELPQAAVFFGVAMFFLISLYGTVMNPERRD